MREWNFDNGIVVKETKFDSDLHCFRVFNGEEYLGTVYPDDCDAMRRCIADLDAGEDPIDYHWNDGLGNSCTLDGWGE